MPSDMGNDSHHQASSSGGVLKQANYAAGNQQVNNGTPEPARARENEILPTKLLEANDGKRLDARAKGEAIGGDQKMAPLGAVHGPQVQGRKGARVRQRL